MKLKFWFLPLVAVLGLSLGLRLFRLEELFYFTHDEETIAWRVMPLLRDNNLFLLGGVTPLHFHLGPWFYYLSALILKLSHLSPLGWGVASAMVGTLTTWLLFQLGKKFYHPRVGLLAALFYATSFLMVAFDRHWWPLVLDPLISVVVILSLTEIIARNYIFTLPLAVALALGFHADPSTWGLLPLTILVWWWYKLPLTRRSTLIAIAVFLASFLPLVAFDLKYQGQNIASVRQYLSEAKPQQGWSFNRFFWTLLFIPRSLSRLLYPGSSELTHSYAYCPEYSQTRIMQASPMFMVTALAILLWFLLKPKKTDLETIISRYFLIIIIGLNLYGNFFRSDLFDHYLATLFPLFFLIVATILDRLLHTRVKWLTVVAIIIVLTLNLKSLTQMSNRFGYQDKSQAVAWTLDQLQGDPFALDSLGGCFRFSGVRYLFMLQGYEPSLSFVDPNFFWLYQPPPTTESPPTLVVLVQPEAVATPQFHSQYREFLTKVIKRRSFGDTEVLIVDNSDQSFSINF